MAILDITKTYYPNGNLASEEHFKNGNLDGLSKTYYSNGRLESEYNYKDGYRHGLCKEYDINGRILKEDNYKEGILDGNRKKYFYHENGKHGISDGLSKNFFYRDNGGLEKIEIHKEVDVSDFQHLNRKLISKIFWYDTEGKLESIENYKEGELDGVVKTYRKGKLHYLYLYKYGIYVTTLMRCSYFRNGQIKTKFNYKQGLVTRYYKGGQIQSKSYYKGRSILRKFEFYENAKFVCLQAQLDKFF